MWSSQSCSEFEEFRILQKGDYFYYFCFVVIQITVSFTFNSKVLLKEMPDIDKMNAQNKVAVICCPDIPLPDVILRSTDIQPETGSDVVAEVIETTEITPEGSMPPTANVE